MKIGDTIKCRDKDDMVDTMLDLAKVGIETDFLYETDGVKLVVTKITPKEPYYKDLANSYEKTINLLTKAIAEQEPRWIPVSERLPKEYEAVIVTSDKWVYPEARYTKKYGWEWASESGANYWEGLDEVKAWMPLPEPYKEVDNE